MYVVGYVYVGYGDRHELFALQFAIRARRFAFSCFQLCDHAARKLHFPRPAPIFRRFPPVSRPISSDFVRFRPISTDFPDWDLGLRHYANEFSAASSLTPLHKLILIATCHRIAVLTAILAASSVHWHYAQFYFGCHECVSNGVSWLADADLYHQIERYKDTNTFWHFNCPGCNICPLFWQLNCQQGSNSDLRLTQSKWQADADRSADIMLIIMPRANYNANWWNIHTINLSPVEAKLYLKLMWFY